MPADPRPGPCGGAGLRSLLGGLALLLPLRTVFAEAEPPIVLYGPGPASPEAEARAVRAFELLGDQPRTSPRPRQVERVLVGIPGLEIVGAEGPSACTGSLVSPEEVHAALGAALLDVNRLADAELQEKLARLDALLPCLNGPLSRDDLANISYYEGVGLANVQRDREAVDSFRNAFLVSPGIQWDNRFNPDFLALFNEAGRLAHQVPMASLRIEPGLARVARIWLDGAEVRANPELGQGRHLLQWQLEEGGFGTRVLQVRGGDVITVRGRDDVLTAVISGRGSEVTRVKAAEALTVFAHEQGLAVVYLVESGPVDLLHRFDVASGTWSRTDLGVVDRRLEERRLRRWGAYSIGGGLIALGTGAVLAVTGLSRAMELMEQADDVPNSDAFLQNEAAYDSAKIRYQAGYAVAGVGVAGAAVGCWMEVVGRPGTAVKAGFLPHGLLLTVEW